VARPSFAEPEPRSGGAVLLPSVFVRGIILCIRRLARTLHGKIHRIVQFDGDSMLVTLVALLCNGQVCLEKVVTNSDQSTISMMDCQVHAQAGIVEWLQNGPYRSWRLESYKCVIGKYTPKNQA
jgi:hypothetical protein